ncbi:MAG: glucose 1-dehydrogenase [Chloroflexi bacterium]|nr:glucose 1-dehydrogenase [Chloroflexota bacterium]
MDRRLAGMVALVTGAGRGIGWAIARGMARAGATVVVTARTSAIAEQRAAELVAEGHQAHAEVLDVADTAGTRAVIERVAETFGHLDVLVNNAAILTPRSALEMTEELWDRHHAVNLRGLFFCSQAAARVMVRQRRGAIINISSTSAILAAGTSVAYYTTKAGVIILTRDLAGEWGPLGIRVNCIAPGGTATQMVPSLLDPAVKAHADASSLLGHIGEPDDLAGPAVFLASDEASHVNGVTLIVDGGAAFWRGRRSLGGPHPLPP